MIIPSSLDPQGVPSRIASLESEVIYLRHMIDTTPDPVTKKLSWDLMSVLVRRILELRKLQ